MGIQGFIVGVLTAEVNPKNIKSLFTFLSDRLGSRLIEIEVEAGGKQLKIKATSQEDLDAAMKAAREFIEEQSPIVGEIPPWE